MRILLFIKKILIFVIKLENSGKIFFYIKNRKFCKFFFIKNVKFWEKYCISTNRKKEVLPSARKRILDDNYYQHVKHK